MDGAAGPDPGHRLRVGLAVHVALAVEGDRHRTVEHHGARHGGQPCPHRRRARGRASATSSARSRRRTSTPSCRATSAPATCASTSRGTSTRARSSSGAAPTASATSTPRRSCGTRTRRRPRRIPLERTLYVRHMALRRMIARWGDNDGPSAVVEHGANPGLVSHFTKQALEEIGARALEDGCAGDRSAVEAALADGRHNDLARQLGVKVIHISERDTQITIAAEGGQRVRQHLVRRGLLRGRHRAGGDGLGYAREAAAGAGVPARRRRSRQPDLPRADGVQDVGALVGAGRRDHRAW